jgi:putative methyltransferase (TIGR04325 family)
LKSYKTLQKLTIFAAIIYLNIANLKLNKMTLTLNVLKYKINKRIIQLFGDKQYASYSDALKDCISNGYENDAIINLAKDKAKAARQAMAECVKLHVLNLNIFPLFSLINELSTQHNSLNVIDFGGADGGHYLMIRQLIRPDIRLKWIVVETAEMVKAMRLFATDELSFCDNLEGAIQKMGKIDILHTAGTIQYTPNPYQCVEKMLESGADYLIFNRQSLNQSDADLITIQRSLLSWHGSNDVKSAAFVDCEIRYPHTNISLKKFEAMVQQNFSITYTYEDITGIKEVQKETIIGKSYVLKKK